MRTNLFPGTVQTGPPYNFIEKGAWTGSCDPHIQNLWVLNAIFSNTVKDTDLTEMFPVTVWTLSQVKSSSLFTSALA